MNEARRPTPRQSPLRSAALAVASGVAYAAAQPDRGLWWLAPFCLVPLLLGLRGQTILARFAIGWICGTVAGSALVLEPIGLAISRYFEIELFWSELIAFGMAQLHGALPFAIFAAIVGDVGQDPSWRTALRCGAALVAEEFARSTLLTGLPWGLLAYALTPTPWFAGSAAIGGALLVSFLLAAANGCVASWIARPFSPATLGLALLLVAVLILPGWNGGDRNESIRPFDASTPTGVASARVSLVQTSRAAAERRDPTLLRRDLESLVAVSGGTGVDLAVWPENSIVAMLPANSFAVEAALQQPAAARYTLFGAPRSEGSLPASPYNSAFLAGAEDPPRRVHDKVRLVPVAESIPDALSGLGLGRSANRAGKDFETFTIRTRSGSSIEFGVLICYESIFAQAARELVQAGAGILLNISNDEWFGGTRGAEQHFAASVMRAIETHRPVLRTTNGGVTAAIDPNGRVVARLPSGEPGVLRLAVAAASDTTPFVRFGHWILWPSLLVLVLDLWLAHAGKWRKPRQS